MTRVNLVDHASAPADAKPALDRIRSAFGLVADTSGATAGFPA